MGVGSFAQAFRGFFPGARLSLEVISAGLALAGVISGLGRLQGAFDGATLAVWACAGRGG